MISVKEAIEKITEQVEVCEACEWIRLEQSAGRILARDLPARKNHPPFPRSPLDGYAIRARDSEGASPGSTVRLKIIDTVYAGERSGVCVGEKEAVRIMTGAPIPDGADTVIMQEHTRMLLENEVEIYEELKAGQNYCPEGEDFREGETLLHRGVRMDFRTIGIAASMGYAEIPVQPSVRVGLLTTGDELVQPGETLPDGAIYNSNLFILRARLEELGAQVTGVDSSADRVEDICREIQGLAEKSDIIVTTGGVSVGEKDLLPEVFERLGIRTLFHGVRAKPGSPVLAGRYGDIPVLALSGNPFGALVHLELLLRPLLCRRMGRKEISPEYREGIAQEDFRKNCKSLRVIRARWENGNVFFPDRHASGVFSSMRTCNCLLELEGRENGVRKGETVCVRMFGDL